MKQGFFDLGTGYNPDANRKTGTKLAGCDNCGLFRSCKSPKMEASGRGDLGVLIIGEAPGETEDEQGTQFVGRTGTKLDNTLMDLGVKFRRDCRIDNSVHCRPPNNETPTSVQINECRHRILKEIETFKPKVIILLGVSAVESVLGHKLSGRIQDTALSSFFSEQIPDQDYKCWICPTYHPSFVVRNEKDPTIERNWIRDLEKAFELARSPVPFPTLDWMDRIITTTNKAEALQYLIELKKSCPPYLVFDYETTGIKPHRDGHEIVTVSFSYNGKGYSFPFFKDPEFIGLIKEILTNKSIGKIAHKCDFESLWTYNRASTELYWPKPWLWDTQLAAHCLDNQKPTGLKFQSYVKFGVLGYDDQVDKYIKSDRPGEDKKSANRFNQIKQAPLHKILYYNAQDSVLTEMLYNHQLPLLGTGFMKTGFDLMLAGSQTMARISQNGIRVNIDQLSLQKDRLTKRIKLSEDKLVQMDEFKLWEKEKKAVLNHNSNPQLIQLFYNILKYPLPEGNKTDEEALNKIGTDFSKIIIQIRKLKKIRDTYLAQYEREIVNGFLHPFFNMHTVSTFRSSSSNPNFQNIPKREKLAKMICRSIIVPRPGNRLIDYDYKGVEVSVSACYNKDPKLIRYVSDPSTDMHRDMGCQLFFREAGNVPKDERQLAKNGFVFPSFYGSTTEEIAPAIWEDMGEETREHLGKNGISELGKFIRNDSGRLVRCTGFFEHVKTIEDDFWNNRFPVYREWKQKVWKDYQKRGYIDSYTGFRYWGPLKFTEATNYPIQGSAFHCLLWTLNNIEERVREISGRSSIIGQIHDDGVSDVHPEDEKQVDGLFNLWGTKKIREHWDWIIVPLRIDKERSEIDGSWDEMSPCEMEG